MKIGGLESLALLKKVIQIGTKPNIDVVSDTLKMVLKIVPCLVIFM